MSSYLSSGKLRAWTRIIPVMLNPAKDGFPPSTTAGTALIHHHTSDLVSTQETPPSRVNQPFINFCNKYPTSLLTLEIACRVYIIFLQLQAS